MTQNTTPPENTDKAAALPDRVVIEGDGTASGTFITDLKTGTIIPLVQSYTVTQKVGEFAHAVIEVAAPFVELECDATIVQAEATPKAVPLTAPSVTPEDIEANIVSEHYFTAAEGYAGSIARKIENHELTNVTTLEFFEALEGPLSLLTFCVLVLKNGHRVVGINYGSTDPSMHSEQRGRDDARAKAIEQVWPLMKYELCSKLAANS